MAGLDRRTPASRPMDDSSDAPRRGNASSGSSERPIENDDDPRVYQQTSQHASADASDDEDEEEAESEEEDHLAWARGLSWLHRPDERWLRPFVLVLATGSGMILGPRIELGTQLVCEEVFGINEIVRPLVTFDASTASVWDRLVNFFPAPHERPPLSSACLSSPEVEAGYTALALRISLAMGILSAITTGFWGGLSDRKGRTMILRLSILGLTIGDLTYITLGLFPQTSVPFGKNLLVLGAAFEGLLGGLATLMAAHMAYIADVTRSGTRATVFSFFTGMFFCGFSLGPGLGGLIAKRLHSTMAPFYFALAAHVLYLVVAALLLPESNSPERMQKARDDHQQATLDLLHGRSNNSTTMKKTISFASMALTPFRPLALLMPHRRHDRVRQTPSLQHARATHRQRGSVDDGASKPLLGPDPAAVSDVHPEPTAELFGHGINASEGNSSSHISVSHARANRLDWNLSLVALAYFLESSIIGILTPKINYARYKYKWDIEEIGYFLSFSSLTRVACLTLIFPAFVKLVHRPIRTPVLPQDGQDGSDSLADEEGAPLLDSDGRLRHTSARPQYGATDLGGVGLGRPSGGEEAASAHGGLGQIDDEQRMDPFLRRTSYARQIERAWRKRAQHIRQLHDSRFDRRLVIGSLAIAALSYLLLAALSDAGPVPFVALSGFISLGGAASAGLSSLALALLDSDRDAGKFFAAWSVLSAISQMIVGPIMFSSLFVRTVAFAPQSIFLLGFVLFVLAAVTVAMIRVRSVRTLPALPPRPHTSASLRAQQQQRPSDSTNDDDTASPFHSSASRLRMRPPNPLQQPDRQQTEAG